MFQHLPPDGAGFDPCGFEVVEQLIHCVGIAWHQLLQSQVGPEKNKMVLRLLKSAMLTVSNIYIDKAR